MITKLYTVYDKVAQEGCPLFGCKNDEVASRIFVNMIKNEAKNGANPSDYELHCVGKFDNEKLCLYTTDVVTLEDGSKDYPDCNYVVPVTFGGENE